MSIDARDSDENVTELLQRWRAGDDAAAERVLEQTYEELRRIARALLRRERPGHTLQATALINEICLRLLPTGPRAAENRQAFLNVVAGEMKRRLIDHARRRLAAKRGGGAIVEPLEGAIDPVAPLDSDEDAQEMLDRLDRALAELGASHARVAQVVELKFFAGLTNEEVADDLKLSAGTVKRDWTFGKAWLAAALEREA
jgi:RNA polymerase sigma-70 factor, ECF subfamily